jgi:hypothetical protein
MVVAKVVLHEEARCDLVEDDAGLWLIVWNVSGILDELGEIELGEREVADFRNELEIVSLVSSNEERGTHLDHSPVDDNTTSANRQTNRNN